MAHRPISASSHGAATRRAAAVVPALLLVAAMSMLSGCSFSWGDGGISDVLFGGRTPEELAPAETEETREAVEAEKEADNQEARLTRVAILPVAYRDATSAVICDLCPSTLEMTETSALSARLATGFTYEAIARHPRFLFPPVIEVEKAVASAPSNSYRAALAALGESGRADVGVVSALVAMRPRVGPNDAPVTPAAVTLYVSLVDARTGKVLWSDVFDDEEKARGSIMKTYDKLANDAPIRWMNTDEFCEYAVDELIEELVDEVE